MALQKVRIVEDGDGHTFVIPSWMVNEFRMLLEHGEQEDDYTEFEEVFGKYGVGGDLSLIELFADIN